MDTLIQQHRAKMQERQTLCAQMKKRNQQYFKLVNEEENKRFDRVFRRVPKRCNMQQQRRNPGARQEEQSHDTRRRGRKRKTDPDRADADREQRIQPQTQSFQSTSSAMASLHRNVSLEYCQCHANTCPTVMWSCLVSILRQYATTRAHSSTAQNLSLIHI